MLAGRAARIADGPLHIVGIGDPRDPSQWKTKEGCTRRRNEKATRNSQYHDQKSRILARDLARYLTKTKTADSPIRPH